MGEGRRRRLQPLTVAVVAALVCLVVPALGQQVAEVAKQAAQQVASSAKEVVQEQLPGASTTANKSPAATGASGAQLDEQVDEAIDAQEYKELPDREVVAQVVTQESAARLANSDGDVATTGEAMPYAQCMRMPGLQTVMAMLQQRVKLCPVHSVMAATHADDFLMQSICTPLQFPGHSSSHILLNAS